MEKKSENRICQNHRQGGASCQKSFVIEPDDFGFYEKINVPPPTFCPLCRAQRRFVFRNERKLFRVVDDFTGKEILSTFPTESGKRIITREEWNGDSWEAMDYGQDYDFSRNFFEQLMELNKKVPIYAFNVARMIDSPYSFNAQGLKNSYLIVNSSFSEDCMYGNSVNHSKNCVDNSHIKQSEKCYECFWLRNCYQCYFTMMTWDSRNMYFCRDCGGCNDCFGCANLRQSSYCIFNKQYTKEEYEVELKKLKLNTVTGIIEARKMTRNFWDTQITRHQQGVKNLNSTGSYVTDSKNVRDSYMIRECEDMRFCQYVDEDPGSKDNYDVSIWGQNTELCYETIECGDSCYNNKFSVNCWPACRNNEYCMYNFSSADCFGCVGLKKKQYCIFNKQYSKEDYFITVEKIKKQMDEMPYLDKTGNLYKYGEFFPIQFSPFGYNNTIAMEHFPMAKEEIEKNGYGWTDVSRGEYKITKKISEIEVSIDDISDEVLKEVIECEKCSKSYRILENELIFLRNEKLPIPTMCNDCRHERRISDRLSIHLYERYCMCAGSTDQTNKHKNTAKHTHGDNECGEKFKTGYSPESSEIVYCEKCYQQEVY